MNMPTKILCAFQRYVLFYVSLKVILFYFHSMFLVSGDYTSEEDYSGWIKIISVIHFDIQLDHLYGQILSY